MMDVLFDLDGTLIDSSPSILESFRQVLAARGLEPVIPLDDGLIGSPLLPTLRRITGVQDGARLEELAARFRAFYDGDGYRKSVPYTGLTEVLAALVGESFRLFLVTNKRQAPTRLILEWFAIAERFTGVYGSDSFAPAAKDKTDMVGQVVTLHNLETDRCFLVGDSAEDAAAAAAHGIRFIAAAYGYGAAATQRTHPVFARIGRLSDLPACLCRARA